ncbi:hypothetical protein NPIL_670471 [Nephila pilipes]|uniref:Uncharacterized protein n=1 Tax=Nephila pilipes TaxID=299642 RepID=A0A8X6PE91_NEPPI|nr:hypothetical protein NPIL_670471 [Nephila pilipes]
MRSPLSIRDSISTPLLIFEASYVELHCESNGVVQQNIRHPFDKPRRGESIIVMESSNFLSNDVLRQNLKDNAKKLASKETLIFQDPKNTSIKTKECLPYNAPRRLITLQQSPDLNPIHLTFKEEFAQ